VRFYTYKNFVTPLLPNVNFTLIPGLNTFVNVFEENVLNESCLYP